MSRGRGFTRSRRAPMRRGGRAKRKILWVAAFFEIDLIGVGVLREFVIATEANFLAGTLGRGTIVAMYGGMRVTMDAAEAIDDTALYAWGICLKEADSVPVIGTTFSPSGDADSTMWMTLRAGQLVKTAAAGAWSQGNVIGEVENDFVIRNPRVIKRDQELVMIFENQAASEGLVAVAFWIRVAVALP